MSDESAVDPVASPCTGVCRLDAATGWCVGCLRSLDEIAACGTLDDAARQQVLDRVAVRRVSRR